MTGDSRIVAPLVFQPSDAEGRQAEQRLAQLAWQPEGGGVKVDHPTSQKTDRAALIYDKLQKTMDDFERSPSLSKFGEIVDGSSRLEQAQSSSVGLAFIDFSQKKRAPGSEGKVREVEAALLMGMGDARTNQGAMIGADRQLPYAQDVGKSLLPDANVDLGGDATREYMSADSQLRLCRERAQRDQPSEINRIEDEQRQINQRLAKIYGAHDIPAVFAELRQFINPGDVMAAAKKQTVGETDTSPIAQLLEFAGQIRSRAANSLWGDANFKAKLNRDLALVDLAIASNQNSPTYKEALRALSVARELAPNAPDQKSLEQLVKDQFG